MSNRKEHVPELVIAGRIAFFFNKLWIKPAKPIVRKEPKIGRNDMCPCYSGKKAKKCCHKES